MYAQQQNKRLRRIGQQRRIDPVIYKCLRVMGMSQVEVFFQKMNFHQFISMSLDQYKAHGDEFVNLYAKLIGMTEVLVDSALSLSDLNSHPRFESTKSKPDLLPAWVPTRDTGESDENDVPMPHTLRSGTSDQAPLIRCDFVFDQPSDEDTQLLDVCPHRIGECDRNASWALDNVAKR